MSSSVWLSWDDWRRAQSVIVEALQDPTEAHVTEALDAIELWTNRQILNVQIEATVDVFNSIKAYVKMPELFTSVASFTIVRFVNGMVDAPQQFGAQHRTVYMVSLEQKVPTILVDMRHSITHGILPSRPVLFEMIKIISEFLVVRYWRTEENESTPMWFSELKRAITRNDVDRLKDIITDGLKNLTTAGVFSISKDIARLAGTDMSPHWKTLVKYLCNRVGFADALVMGATLQFCADTTDIGLANWLLYLLKNYNTDIQPIVEVFIQNGLIFDVNVQELLVKSIPMINAKQKGFLDAYIVVKKNAQPNVTLKTLTDFLESKPQLKTEKVGRWTRVPRLNYFTTDQQSLVIPQDAKMYVV
ncbi:hypothetical protein EIN_229410 [Entamoeba invadens IP1]|uniref:Uncharacterized protein n=1 Tax=Entamoeba invadens IP1 TaxID=370355 RepID=A0A0A1U8V8_ENTIV|nr:hypothetical protein EIN_229410 [Entamoeba invadens IP1]ELP88418.1 hypothetical protein EIN_229410 [Entamoeba invadens IP1]|eukprot:XP_004255189.1 hypothetical protein EIN_229410 [Entamoeba invadens IP1]